ncbi:MAG TPA: site-specific integrase, partial [Steroidobacteraceae bacterium]
MAALGLRREVAERRLGHKLKGVEGTYDRHYYFNERRLALSQWTQLILEAERGKDQATKHYRSAPTAE